LISLRRQADRHSSLCPFKVAHTEWQHPELRRIECLSVQKPWRTKPWRTGAAMSETQATQAKWRRLAEQCRDAARNIPQGQARDKLLEKANNLEAAARLEGWLNSPGLRAPEGKRA